MTQYLLSVWSREGETPLTDEEIQQSYADTGAFNEQVRKEGAWVFAGGLHPPCTATVVDGRGEEPVTTDGPFAESKEQLGGFWVVDVPDLDAALDLARRGSAACRNPVEVRPFQGD
ncbi:MAG: YciI family protein [Actinomycetota bacterium]|nr:YciI family protein [Actinomycetota bacterium]